MQLPTLAAEIREELIRVTARNGGHVGPNLGVVELTIALHRVFSTPRDKFVFDVAHQGYVHKLLTGRLAGLQKVRQTGGASGFLNRAESPHDAFGAGHAGTALSAALGMATARDLKGTDEHVVALCGDAGDALGDSIYETHIYVRGSVKGLGADCIEKELKENSIYKGKAIRGTDNPRFLSPATDPSIVFNRAIASSTFSRLLNALNRK
jgi:hypothetical protein